MTATPPSKVKYHEMFRDLLSETPSPIKPNVYVLPSTKPVQVPDYNTLFADLIPAIVKKEVQPAAAAPIQTVPVAPIAVSIATAPTPAAPISMPPPVIEPLVAEATKDTDKKIIGPTVSVEPLKGTTVTQWDDTFLLSPDAAKNIEECIRTSTTAGFLEKIRSVFGENIPASTITQFWYFAMQRLAFQSLLVNAHKLNKKLHDEYIVSERDSIQSANGGRTFYARLRDLNSDDSDRDIQGTKWDDVIQSLFITPLSKASETGQPQKVPSMVEHLATKHKKYPHPEVLLTLARGFSTSEIDLFTHVDAAEQELTESANKYATEALQEEKKKWWFSTLTNKITSFIPYASKDEESFDENDEKHDASSISIKAPDFLILPEGASKEKWAEYMEKAVLFLHDPPKSLDTASPV